MATPRRKTCCGNEETFCEWLRSPTFAIYTNYVLSAWGDWMWQFAAGLYLVYLADDMLRLAAIFGFTGGTLMLILGGIIGDWVDKNGRLKVVGISLFVQNLSVALCATAVCLALVYRPEIALGWGGYLRPVVEGIIIFLAIIAFLSSMAYKIAIEKDWIVVIARGNKSQLTNLNAVTRGIDLSCKILAPTVAGLIMSYSRVTAAICIAVWNVVSVFCEYAILRKVYNMVPELALKGMSQPNEQELEEIKAEKEPMNRDFPVIQSSQEKLSLNGKLDDAGKQLLNKDNAPGSGSQELCNSEHAGSLTLSNGKREVSKEAEVVQETSQEKKEKTCLQQAAEPFLILAKGWKTYGRQKMVFAGMSLAFLYMTVLGFDSVTCGYIYTNGVDELYVGISMGAAGLTGILGTLTFSFINKRVGLERTGLIAYSVEILCLILTVASVWAPGTVFDPTFSGLNKPSCNVTIPELVLNVTHTTAPLLEDPALSGPILEARRRRALPLDTSDWLQELQTGSPSNEFLSTQLGLWHSGIDGLHDNLPMALPSSYNYAKSQAHDPLSTHSFRIYKRDVHNASDSEKKSNTLPADIHIIGRNGSGNQSAMSYFDEAIPVPANYANFTTDCNSEQASTSITLFLVGIVTSRIGLWMADLVVTQLIQENVAEQERGIVNGVQNSLNMLMDMIKFILVIAMPKVETFGILIILSFCFIIIAGSLFTHHVWRVEKGILKCSPKQTIEMVIDNIQENGDAANV